MWSAHIIMKKTIETVVLFSMYMVNDKKDNLEDIAAKIVCVIGVDNVLKAYDVMLGYESKHVYNIKSAIARSIILDLLQQQIK